MKWLLVTEGDLAGQFLMFSDEWAEARIERGEARELSREEDWPLETEIEDYLDKTPDGPKAKLAWRILHTEIENS